MEEEQKRTLAFTVNAIQQKFGRRAIRRLGEAGRPPIPYIPTGFAALDEALTTRGLPRGHLTEIFGAPTSGVATLTLQVMARAQQLAAWRGLSDRVAYFDMGGNFDPDYAARCGVNLQQLIVIRPYTIRQGMLLLPDLLSGPGFNLVVMDAPLTLLTPPAVARELEHQLMRLKTALRRNGATLIFLTSLRPGEPAAPHAYPAGLPLPSQAAVRLLIERERWIYHRRDIIGYEARIRISKNQLGPAGRDLHVSIHLPRTPAGLEL